jgi:hypothetical protein
LVEIKAPNIHHFANRVLDRIFSKESILNGAIEPTGRGGYQALDQIKIDRLKGLKFFYNLFR